MSGGRDGGVSGPHCSPELSRHAASPGRGTGPEPKVGPALSSASLVRGGGGAYSRWVLASERGGQRYWGHVVVVRTPGLGLAERCVSGDLGPPVTPRAAAALLLPLLLAPSSSAPRREPAAVRFPVWTRPSRGAARADLVPTARVVRDGAVPKLALISESSGRRFKKLNLRK